MGRVDVWCERDPARRGKPRDIGGPELVRAPRRTFSQALRRCAKVVLACARTRY